MGKSMGKVGVRSEYGLECLLNTYQDTWPLFWRLSGNVEAT